MNECMSEEKGFGEHLAMASSSSSSSSSSFVKGQQAISQNGAHVSLPENIAGSVSELIGWTPLVEIKSITKNENVLARVVGKLEYFQPGFSVKDRIALKMILDAESKGLIKPEASTLVEPTSGNTGIGLALVGIHRGYKVAIVMPATYSLERRMILRALGAELHLTNPELGFEGVLNKTQELLASTPNSHMLNQLGNLMNNEAHYCSTGGCKGSHQIQGIGPGFIADVTDKTIMDEIVTVSSEEAIEYAQRLMKEEGLLVGISSGAALAGALKVAKHAENKGKLIVVVLPSAAERYLSTMLFADIKKECESMTY
ncbi:hypothetical protein O6H91_20G077500 [Diphasiastrum complanatum]|uniref:Uncharacterized protein n=1 Tax=Diphasiastrum complanatum TaxID=34168 RepID=A0ACC2ATF1_DIPCM|nr:hypothetical protein O6H91_20G077500 [Diphasiastrum complanatum]